jgi:hypothetical protein
MSKNIITELKRTAYVFSLHLITGHAKHIRQFTKYTLAVKPIFNTLAIGSELAIY